MTWKAIGQSVTGTSHIATSKACEDAVHYRILTGDDGAETLICCVADGAGSALQAQWASAFATDKVVELAAQHIAGKEPLTEALIYTIAEDIYASLQQQAEADGMELNEYSCTLLGCIITPFDAAFFQVGDGAIVRNDGDGFYTTMWWPHNGEYHNSTSFLVDDPSFSNLNITILNEQVDEVAIFTDGLQMLTLRMDDHSVHQPFFNNLFGFLRKASTPEQLTDLDNKLAAYLDSDVINNRTDDDKTLFLATRLTA